MTVTVQDDVLEQLAATPAYRHLTRTRNRFAAALTTIILIAYFGFILLIAFDPTFLGRSISGGAMTLGVPVGLGIIILAITLTALYVWRANRVFDADLAAVLRAGDA